MQIELLHVPDCPNLDRARDRLREALAAGSVAASIRETEITTPEAAARAGMRGSPTILVDGADPFGPAAGAASLSCRLFRTPDGIEGAPSVAQLASALARRAAGSPPRGPDAGRR